MKRTIATFCKSFYESLFHPIDVSHILKAVEDRQTYCIAPKENFEQLSECLKQMFLSIPDSVMNSQI